MVGPTNPTHELRAFLEQNARNGEVSSSIDSLLAKHWHDLDGSDQGGMESNKLIGRDGERQMGRSRTNVLC